jgi:hypothetical protein
LNQAILIAINMQVGGMAGEHVHVANFSGALAEAAEGAKDAAFIAFGIEMQGLRSGFEAAGVSA